jgi:hypothetical protein
MNNQHLDFKNWYYHTFKDINGWWTPDGDTLFKQTTEIGLTEKNLMEIFGFFDHFMGSPNSTYYDEQTRKTYPIGSRSLTFETYEDLKVKITRYRQHYEKLILYTLGINRKNGNFYVRFAVFPSHQDNCGHPRC